MALWIIPTTPPMGGLEVIYYLSLALICVICVVL